MIPAWARQALGFSLYCFPATAFAAAEPGVGARLAELGLSEADLIFAAAVTGLALLLLLLAVTRRRLSAARAEGERLSARGDRLREMLAAAPDGYLCWDLEEGTETTSARLAGLLGFGPDDARDFAAIRGRFGGDETGADETGTLDEAVAALRSDGKPFDLLLTYGTGMVPRTFRVMGVRAADRAGKPVADLVWFRDLSGFVAETARLLAESETLAAEKKRLQALLDSIPTPVWLRNSDLSLSFCNRAYAQAVETDPVAAVAENRQIAGSVVANRGTALAERARLTGMIQRESHHIAIGGERRLLEFAEVPLDGTGVDTGEVAGYAMDFTDLEEVQTDLSREIAAHEDVLKNLSTAIALYGADKRLRFFNTAYVKLWRLDEGWLRTGPDFGSVLEAQREARRLPEVADFRAFKEERLRLFTSLIEPHEELLHLPDETTLHMDIVPHPFGGLLFTFEDVTDKLALERSYNTLIAVQRETLDNLWEGVAVFGRDGLLKLSNPAYGRMWNLSSDQLAGEPHISDVVEWSRGFYGIEDDRQWAAAKERMVAEIIETSSRSGQLERSDGSILAYTTEPLPDGNVLLRYVDATDRYRVEQALRERNQALETASRLKSEFIANVSYELRTPLNTIIGFSEILRKEYFGKLNTRQTEYSDGIIESSQHLLALINDILDLATIEAGYMALELEAFDVHEMLIGIVSLTRERARNRELDLKIDCAPDIGTLYADPRRLKQAVFNLVSNSIKFTPPGGAITLIARRAEDEMAITVADTGIGLAAEDQERVFEKFVQVPSGQARKSGAGLGLSLVKSLIELHGGRVVMESAPGAGARVTCFVPTHAADSRAASAAGGG